ncbi:putative complex I intermediate-associated protein 30, mitochondrial [[Candida] jaroonii]|uniref:Complex I intermediate-associated protein 30, mitochondrial n=1 Tax=[Candida] jaroonii TaxID=467808 RepID=A0ACA9Y468_9ASCO|nr:putative complex I intermediate-associated protein 30, mitochondrial [[Candida] jaroonii]
MFKSLFKKPPILNYHTILDFKSPETLKNIITRSDKEIGGYSSTKFIHDPIEKCGKFIGELNLDLPKDNPDVTRSGYAMFRTKDQPQSLFNTSFWDWSRFSSLVMRVKGDRRKYLINLQANTPMITDLYQHRLFLNDPGNWETVVIPLDDFVVTNWGVIQDQSELNKSEIKTFGVGLLDKTYGPFELAIDWVKVMNDEELKNYTEIKKSEKEEQTEHSAFPASNYPEPKATVF